MLLEKKELDWLNGMSRSTTEPLIHPLSEAAPLMFKCMLRIPGLAAAIHWFLRLTKRPERLQTCRAPDQCFCLECSRTRYCRCPLKGRSGLANLAFTEEGRSDSDGKVLLPLARVLDITI